MYRERERELAYITGSLGINFATDVSLCSYFCLKCAVNNIKHTQAFNR